MAGSEVRGQRVGVGGQGGRGGGQGSGVGVREVGGQGVRRTCALYMHCSLYSFPILLILPLTLTWRQPGWEGRGSSAVVLRGVGVREVGSGSDIPVRCMCTGVTVGSPSCSSSL